MQYRTYCIVIAWIIRNNTKVQRLCDSEQKIVDLCAKVLASAQFSEEFQLAMGELRVALHEYTKGSRDKVAEMALLVAAREESSAAD
jgi:hypothetical protein